jgi:hypothetical protein
MPPFIPPMLPPTRKFGAIIPKKGPEAPPWNAPSRVI